MKICPNCHHHEVQGALFCSECGGHLGQEDQNPVIQGSLSIYLIDHDHELAVTDLESFTLGRFDEGQSIMPDIDLSPYQAFEQGVSRLHAIIRNEQGLTITDLGSSNGTYINGERVEPNIPHPITQGNLLNLGKMKLKILIRD